MKLRLIPLGLAACLALTLAACTGGSTAQSVPPSESAPATEAVSQVTDVPAPGDSATPTPEPSQDPAPTPGVPSEVPTSDTPDESSIPDKGTPPPTWTHHPDDHHTVTPAPTPAWTHHPDDHHTATPAATPAVPSETPPADPSDPPQEVTAPSVYAAVSAAAGVSYDDMTAYVDAFYPGLDTADLADYVFYQPSMSGQIEEIFIAKVNSGKLDAVKSACSDRQQGMVEDAEMYPDTGTYVASYQLVTEGDWLLFCVGPNAQGAVTAFQNAVK